MSFAKYPRYARWRDQTVRILEYLGEGRFEVLDKEDARRVIHRDDLSFRRSGKKA